MDTHVTDQEKENLRARYDEIASLAGGLAHEIKNPLSTIGMNLDLLLEDIQQGDAARDRRMRTKIQTVQKECRHLEEILDAFLQFARVRELDLVKCNLNELIGEFIEFFRPQADENQIEISPHLAADLPSVMLDRPLFRQVLMNLALNALQAMPEGGMIELQSYSRDNRVFLDVIDNGAGMTETTKQKMFQAFYSTKPGGNGLGLPTIYKIVESHNGTITCESEPDRGTRFIISLPIAD